MIRQSRAVAAVSGGILALLVARPSWPDAKDVDVMVSVDCDHSVDIDEVELEGKDSDVIVWRVRSRCATEQKVAICSETKDPFAGCVSVPGGHGVGTAFPVANRQRVVLYCAPDYRRLSKKETFKFDIRVGPTASCAKTDADGQGRGTGTLAAGSIVTHKLDVVIVP